MSAKQIAASSLKEFMDSNRYKTVTSQQSNKIDLQIQFKSPWSVSNETQDVLRVEICG